MTLERFKEIFDSDGDRNLRKNDLAVFNILAKYMKDPTKNIICASEHDQIYLNFDVEELAENISEEDAIFLRSNSVFIDEYDSLSMFV